MKILHYVDTFSRLSETFIYDLINLLEADSSKTGIQHIVLCHKRENEDTRPFQNLHIIEFGFTKWRRLQIKLGVKRWEIPSLNKVHKFISHHKPDIIHAHFGQSGVRMHDYFGKKRVYVPLVVQCHGTDAISLPCFDKGYAYKLQKIGLNKKNIFIGNTDFLCETIENIGIPKHRIKKVTYSLNKDFLKNLEFEKKIIKNGSLRIVSVGRLIKWKGHKYLIDAIGKLYNNYSQKIALTIVGEGAEFDPLKKQVEILGINDIVTFTGAVTHREVKKIIREHDILVQPSIIDIETKQRESFGLTILEAIANDLPVIVTDTGGMPELVGRETPYSRIVEPASSESLVQAINFFIKNPVDRCGMKKYSENRLDVFSQKNQLDAVYEAYKILLNEQ